MTTQSNIVVKLKALKRKEAALKAWETRKRNSKLKSKTKTCKPCICNRAVSKAKHSKGTAAALKAWETRRKNEALLTSRNR